MSTDAAEAPSRTVEADLDELDATASSMEGCGNGLREINLHAAVEHVPPLLPGTETAPAAVEAAARLTAAVAITADRVLELARLTRECAAAYRAADEDARRRFQALIDP